MARVDQRNFGHWIPTDQSKSISAGPAGVAFRMGEYYSMSNDLGSSNLWIGILFYFQTVNGTWHLKHSITEI
jgi:hypothetical protein